MDFSETGARAFMEQLRLNLTPYYNAKDAEIDFLCYLRREQPELYNFVIKIKSQFNI